MPDFFKKSKEPDLCRSMTWCESMTAQLVKQIEFRLSVESNAESNAESNRDAVFNLGCFGRFSLQILIKTERQVEYAETTFLLKAQEEKDRSVKLYDELKEKILWDLETYKVLILNDLSADVLFSPMPWEEDKGGVITYTACNKATNFNQSSKSKEKNANFETAVKGAIKQYVNRVVRDLKDEIIKEKSIFKKCVIL